MALHPLSALGFERITHPATLARLGFEPDSPALSASARAAARRTAAEPRLKPQTNEMVVRPQALGGLTAGRMIVQPTDSPAINQALATAAMPAYTAALERLVRSIPGARLAGWRNAKHAPRLAEKIMLEGQPAETVSDYGAAQIAVDSPHARDAVAAAVQQHFPVLRQQDHFALGDPEYHYRCLSLQIGMPNQASEELQIVPREVWQANQQEHHEYKEARDAELAGRPSGKARAAARAMNDSAMEQFNSRNGVRAAIVKGAVVKGSRVRLADGALARVVYVDPNMRIARVRTEDGRNLTVRRKDLR